MYNLTQTVETENHGTLVVPVNPFQFGKAIEAQQDRLRCDTKHTVLFNKGRYFETSIYDKELLKQVSELAQIPIKYDNMIVGSWRKLEDFVVAMNCFEIYVKIDIDWI